jgi:hypothetical protein
MSKVTPREYYVCDYCGKKSDEPDFKYTDDSGLDNKTYEMCSDICYWRHVDYLRLVKKLAGKDLEKHIKQIRRRYGK